MQEKKKKRRNKKVHCSPWIIFIPRKLQQLQEIPTTTWQSVAMGTKYFSVGLNNTSKGNGCGFRGSGWTLGNNFFIGAVVNNQNRQSLEILKDLPRQSNKHSQTHIHVYEHVNPRLPVILQHLTHKIAPIHVPAKHPQLCGLTCATLTDRLLVGLWSDLIHCSLPTGALQGFVRSSTAERNDLQPVRQQIAAQAVAAQFFDSSKGVFPKPFKYKSTGFI